MSRSGHSKYTPMQRRHLWTDTWLPELLASAFSMICLGALIVLFMFADGSVIRVWHGLTLNTLVSILSTASKAAALVSLSSTISQWRWCLFRTQRRNLIDFECLDTASRGPLGCFWLLWRTRRGSWVWIGALTVIAAIAFDPFSQQLVQYGNRPDCHDSAAAAVPRAMRYSLGHEYGLQVQTPDTAHEWTAADFSMQSAILYGLNEPANRVKQQLVFRCPTQNCTWTDSFDSLAICSKCQDLNSKLQKSQDGGLLASVLEVDDGAGTRNVGTKFALPNGLYIDGQNGWKYDPKSRKWTGNTYANNGGVIGAVILMSSFGTGQPNLTNTMQSAETLIWSESMIRIKPDIPSPDVLVWPDIPIEAFECSLYYCVNNYNTHVTNGTLLEMAREQTSIRRNPASWTPLQPDFNPKPFNTTSAALDSIVFDRKLSTIARSDLMLGDSFNLSQSAVDSISAYFGKTFAADPPSSQATGLNGWYVDDGNEQYFPSVMQRLRTAPNLTDVFQNVATSMTNAVRAGADGGLTREGQLCEQATIYRIEWVWITLPLLVVVAGAVQLVISMTWTAKTQTPIWKSSSLATLSRGRFASAVFEGANMLSEMDEKARKSAVTLFPESQLIQMDIGKGTAVSQVSEVDSEFNRSTHGRYNLR